MLAFEIILSMKSSFQYCWGDTWCLVMFSYFYKDDWFYPYITRNEKSTHQYVFCNRFGSITLTVMAWFGCPSSSWWTGSKRPNCTSTTLSELLALCVHNHHQFLPQILIQDHLHDLNKTPNLHQDQDLNHFLMILWPFYGEICCILLVKTQVVMCDKSIVISGIQCVMHWYACVYILKWWIFPLL